MKTGVYIIILIRSKVFRMQDLEALEYSLSSLSEARLRGSVSLLEMQRELSWWSGPAEESSILGYNLCDERRCLPAVGAF